MASYREPVGGVGIKEVERRMQAVLSVLADLWGPKVGSTLFVFDYGEGGGMAYGSTAERRAMLTALREFLLTQQAPETEKAWQRRITAAVEARVRQALVQSPVADPQALAEVATATALAELAPLWDGMNRVVRAWTVEGVSPPFHRAAQRAVMERMPVLVDALRALAAVWPNE